MPPLAAGSKLLVEFRAGKMIREGKLVKPDERKGLLRVIRTEDGLTHLEWYHRSDGDSTAAPEDDVVIFPEEATFSQVGKPSQRVMQVKFPQEAERNMLFWMQEPTDTHDAELIARTNKVLNEAMDMDIDEWPSAEELVQDMATYTPSGALERGHTSGAPASGLVEGGGPALGVVPAGPGQELGPPPGDMAAQLAQMLSGMAGRPGGSGAAGAGAGAGGGGGGGRSDDAGAALMAALLSAVAKQEGGSRGLQRAALGPGLSEVLRPEVLTPLLQDPEVLEQLSPYLPEGQRTASALRDTAHSPQFQQQLATFSGALQTGQLDLNQFGLTAQGFSVADFLSAIQDLVDREQQQQQEPKTE